MNRKAFNRTWPKELLASYRPYIIAIIVLAAIFPAIPPYGKSMLTQILIFGLFAMSLNLLLGYTGLFSLGHAAFFGAASYTTAILITRFEITSFWLAAPAGIFVATGIAAIFGIIALRSTGIYFLFITLALGELLAGAALKWRGMTKGSGGIIGIGWPDLGVPFTMGGTSFYYMVLVITFICAFAMYRLVNSPFGHAIQGVREDETLMKHLGYNTWLYKYITFIIAGFFAGVAGVLFTYFNKIVVPDYLGVLTSTQVALMVIIGSFNFLFGPMAGAAIILIVQYYVGLVAPARWSLILGIVFVVTIVLLRRGVLAEVVRLWKRYRYGSTTS